ncbi:ABC transporter ATP-binding protein [Neobacillus novalis]|uniref:ABC transporter ATP-binding protein n=1 Tax=Neobacillus novalis TaxID=220687 RepID=A0AA95MHZ1_9BACI|nr:ABC transporter ATP-binding protein [Neobacillus novalis]WHY84001.1 ABC transporter ATP-binding protein [Neobacillus novalis]
MLRINNMTTGYGMADVLHGFDMELNKGEIIAVVGANGAGKSTLMRAISGLLPLKSGSIKFNGKDISKVSAHTRVDQGLVQVPEGRQVFGPLSVVENLTLGFFSKRKQGKTQLQKRLEYAYHLFPKLAERKGQKAGSLSGGEQQMLVIARALMSDPSLLLLDEPSLGLSPLITEQIFEVLVELNKNGLSILLVEQNAFETLSISDRGYLIENGNMVLNGDSKQLLNNPKVTEVYLGNEAIS